MAKDKSTLLKATTGYLSGKIADGETLVGEELNNDIIQFFEKLMSLAGLTPNGNYDNETNGYQFIDALIKAILGGTILKLVQIGDWNMDTTDSVTIVHNLDFNKILGIHSILIINDNNDGKFHFISPNTINLSLGIQGACKIDSTNIYLTRLASGSFDNTSFNSTSYNRGWIIIDYLP